MDTLFTVRNERLAALSSQSAVNFFRDLLWAEARRIGFPLNKINISLWTNVPDGGIDASVSEGEAPPNTGSDLIKPGVVGYQIKTGDSFKPWQPAQIKGELFSGGLVRKENLGNSVRACLENDGTYVLVCFGLEFADNQHRETVDQIMSLFRQCGFQEPKVEVWGQSTVVGFSSLFPSIVLRLQGFDQSRFQTHETWSMQDDMRQDFKLGATQEALIEGIQTELRRNDQAIHARVWGEPGIGKTRLALEATRVDDLLPLIIYCDSADAFRDSVLMNEILKKDNTFSVILIIDECNPDSRSYIWNKLKHLGSRVKLVTIYQEYDDTSGPIVYFNAPGLEIEPISEIIRGYGIDQNQVHKWAELCTGSPRVAHVIGWNLKNNPTDLLRPLDTVNIWDRYIVGSDNPQSTEVRQRTLVLQHLALFKLFGASKPVADEADAIAQLVSQVDPQITRLKFQQIIVSLQARKILQGQVTLYITPKALHIYLWISWWDTFGTTFNFEDFSKNIPGTLLEWFYEQFKYAAESDAASRIVSDLLGNTGPFYSDDYLKTKLGSEFFLALAEANPEMALKCLKRTVGDWSKEERLQTIESRQNIVWALERIAVWKPLFRDAARLLLLLGESEISSYSNNASGIFADLFSPAPAPLAPTEASPEERFPILVEALHSESTEKRMLGLEACAKGLETRSFTRVVGAEYQGLRRANLWMPKDREEFIEAYKRIWQLLFLELDTLELQEQNKAVEILLENARGLTRVPELAPIVIEHMGYLEKKPYIGTKSILELAEEILYYDKKNLPIDITQGWEELRDQLVGNDFSSLMRRWVGMDLLEDRYDEEGQRVDKARKPINALVQQSIVNNDLIREELAWLTTIEAKNGYRFGHELGLQDQGYLLLPTLLEAQRAVANHTQASELFLGGYLRVIFERDRPRWEAILDDLAEDTKLNQWVASLTWRSGMTNRAALRILKLAEKNTVDIRQLGLFGIGSAISDLSEPVFKKWLAFLLQTPEDTAISIALDLFHFFYLRQDTKYRLPRNLTMKLLSHPTLFQNSSGGRSQMDYFHWNQIGATFVKVYPDFSLSLAALILAHFGEQGTVLDGIGRDKHKVINIQAQKYPAEVWQLVTKYLGPPIDARAWHITLWLRGEWGFGDDATGSLLFFPPPLVWQWVEENIEKRAWYLATFVPKELNRGSWVHELLIRYGERDDVRRNLYANFGTGGWIGSASAYFEEQKNMLLNFRVDEDNVNVLRWIDDFVEQLEKQIAHEKILEEREY